MASIYNSAPDLSIRTQNLTYTYYIGSPLEKKVLSDISISIDSGEFVAIIGQSGAGKSTLLKVMSGLMEPTSGNVFVRGKDIFDKKHEIYNVGLDVGVVFQNPEQQLFADTVIDDIAFGPKNMGMSDEDAYARAEQAAMAMGITPDQLSKSPFELSGGQSKRVAIAGIFAMQPKILMLDEPVAGLDFNGAQEMFDRINAYRAETSCTIVLVTHSMEDVAQYAERVLVIDAGKIIMDNTPQSVFSQYELLQQYGLKVPQITEVCRRLSLRGLPIEKNMFTVKHAKSAIVNAFLRTRDFR